MTVLNTTRIEYHTGDNNETSFAYSFRIYQDSDLVVTLTDLLGAETTQTLGVDYTVTGAGDATGTVEMTVAPPLNHVLRIERVLPLTQLIDLRGAGSFLPENHEEAFDRAIMLMQQVLATAASAAGGALPTFTTATKPAASGAWAGKFIRVIDASVPGRLEYCEINADGATYSWSVVATGGW